MSASGKALDVASVVVANGELHRVDPVEVILVGAVDRAGLAGRLEAADVPEQLDRRPEQVDRVRALHRELRPSRRAARRSRACRRRCSSSRSAPSPPRGVPRACVTFGSRSIRNESCGRTAPPRRAPPVSPVSPSESESTWIEMSVCAWRPRYPASALKSAKSEKSAHEAVEQLQTLGAQRSRRGPSRARRRRTRRSAGAVLRAPERARRSRRRASASAAALSARSSATASAESSAPMIVTSASVPSSGLREVARTREGDRQVLDRVRLGTNGRERFRSARARRRGRRRRPPAPRQRYRTRGRDRAACPRACRGRTS